MGQARGGVHHFCPHSIAQNSVTWSPPSCKGNQECSSLCSRDSLCYHFLCYEVLIKLLTRGTYVPLAKWQTQGLGKAIWKIFLRYLNLEYSDRRKESICSWLILMVAPCKNPLRVPKTYTLSAASYLSFIRAIQLFLHVCELPTSFQIILFFLYVIHNYSLLPVTKGT